MYLTTLNLDFANFLLYSRVAFEVFANLKSNIILRVVVIIVIVKLTVMFQKEQMNLIL